MYLFSVSKNGVAATEIQRHTGVTYKTAWRMGHKIRELMAEDRTLEGIIEVDETYIGGRHRRYKKYSKKYSVFGAVERNGSVRAVHVRSTGARVLLPEIQRTVKPGSTIYSDEWGAYRKLSYYEYTHDTVNHSKYEWSRENVYTNTIEGFWGQMKRSFSGTHHSISKKWLQHYVDEFTFKYNHRSGVFELLLGRLVLSEKAEEFS
jgi:transposase